MSASQRFISAFCLALLVHAAQCVRLWELDQGCKKVLWLTGLQLQAGGKQAEYITSSNTYRDSYLVALRSAAENAPSLVPVLVVQGQVDPQFVADVRALGGQVIPHRLSFADLLKHHVPDLASGLRGSYLRVDVSQILPKALAVVDTGALDTEYVLWTDPDVLFMGDIHSCSLPKPRFLSIGPDATHFNADNCGVIYYNVSGFAEAMPALIDWSVQQGFKFKVADQDMLKKFFNNEALRGPHITQLPDTYNWKPYWGRPSTAAFWSKAPDIKVVHFHGPKLDLMLCIVDELRRRGVARESSQWYATDAANEEALAEACGCRSQVVKCSSLFGLAAHAYAADDGEYVWKLKGTFDEYMVKVKQLVGHGRQHGSNNNGGGGAGGSSQGALPASTSAAAVSTPGAVTQWQQQVQEQQQQIGMPSGS